MIRTPTTSVTAIAILANAAARAFAGDIRGGALFSDPRPASRGAMKPKPHLLSH